MNDAFLCISPDDPPPPPPPPSAPLSPLSETVSLGESDCRLLLRELVFSASLVLISMLSLFPVVESVAAVAASFEAVVADAAAVAAAAVAALSPSLLKDSAADAVSGSSGIEDESLDSFKSLKPFLKSSWSSA